MRKETIKYNYTTNEKGDNTVTAVYSDSYTETVTTDSHGNTIFEDVFNVCKTIDIEYGENGKIKSQKNNFSSYFNYNDNGEIAESGNTEIGLKTTYKTIHADDHTVIKQEYLNGELNVDSVIQTFENGNQISSSLLYNTDGTMNDTFEVSIMNRGNDNTKKISKISDNYIIEEEYDENGCPIVVKHYRADHETYFEYDENQQETRQEIWVDNELIRVNDTVIEYNENNTVSKRDIFMYSMHDDKKEIGEWYKNNKSIRDSYYNKK